MSRVFKTHLDQITETVASQLALIESLRFAVTEQQAESGNHLHQDVLQEQLDRFTAVAANLNRALDELAA